MYLYLKVNIHIGTVTQNAIPCSFPALVMLVGDDGNLVITWVYHMFKDTKKGTKLYLNLQLESFKGQS